MLEALLQECRDLAGRVEHGEAKLAATDVAIAPPTPLPRPDGSLPLNISRS